MPEKLIVFLQKELSISSESITLALRHKSENVTDYPIILWQYGLITREELNLIFDWLETS
ncbi:MAG: DUF2949 domain-containing protein [Prochloraceae cyanobacterium]|nr:DUF2949 domain-containing protein [Prochloraceae cyanobacterium]